MRPAFYLADAAELSSGNGTESKPYTISASGNIPSNTPAPSPTAKPTPKPISTPTSFTINYRENDFGELIADVTYTADSRTIATVIIAEYQDGKLINLWSENSTFLANDTYSYSIPQNGKIFVWNSLEGMQSLVK